MTDQGFKRKLAAILSADVKGYSKLMGDDDESTANTITAYRKIFTELIQTHQGRVVDTPGDNILAEFGSALNAVNSAIAIQRALENENHKLPENRRMVFRIGINLGDILHKDDCIYGDGVNIAARIESLAEPGGICISRGVFDQVSRKINQGFEYLGGHKVKNIPELVRIYRVLLGAGYEGKVIDEPTSKEKMAYPLPEKPSIAVLPFDNMSGDPKQEFFSDGITEEIISSLSKTDQLFVIARNSTFTYKGKPVKIKQVAEELGVRYVLEGSVRKSEDRVRITTQLIDAVSGHHLWANRYDRDLKEIFALQDELTMKIVNSLRIKLSEGEQARMWGDRYKDLDVQLKAMEAHSLWRKGTKESLIRHGQIAQDIIDMAPENPFGYIILATNNWILAMLGKSPQESIAKAFKLVQKAISLDESFAMSHGILGNVYLLMRDYEKAIAAGRRSVELEPNGAMVHVMLGSTLGYAGRLNEAIGHLNQGLRLNPFPPYWYFYHLGRCYRQKGQYEEALSAFEKGLHQSPDAIGNFLGLAGIYVLLDRQGEANAAVKKILEIDPNFSVEDASKAWPYKNQADLKLEVDALREAGLTQ